MNIIAENALKHTKNVAMAGILMIITSITNSSMRAVTSNVTETIVKDIRKIRNNIREKKQEQ